jgi:anti-sigma regulatory factor (Ser/Thr protein kinase)
METTEDAIVPPYRAQVYWVVDAGPPNVSVVRAAARGTVQNWGLSILADDVALIVGELAANAWTHGQPPVVVMLRLEDSSILIAVSDAGPGMMVFSQPDALGVHGRGLPIVASIAHEVGLYADCEGKLVWARLRFQWAVPSDETESAAVPSADDGARAA